MGSVSLLLAGDYTRCAGSATRFHLRVCTSLHTSFFYEAQSTMTRQQLSADYRQDDPFEDKLQTFGIGVTFWQAYCNNIWLE